MNGLHLILRNLMGNVLCEIRRNVECVGVTVSVTTVLVSECLLPNLSEQKISSAQANNSFFFNCSC